MAIKRKKKSHCKHISHLFLQNHRTHGNSMRFTAINDKRSNHSNNVSLSLLRNSRT